MDPAIRTYYNAGLEHQRLLGFPGALELTRTRELLLRHLPPPPARVLDVGGGTGVHAAWLADSGYAVHLIDPMPLHVEQAEPASAAQPQAPFTAAIGDARKLAQDDASVDAVLLLGPLYHLTARRDRLAVLGEARRWSGPAGRCSLPPSHSSPRCWTVC
jgi:ubiquinone/menaquinone biosynthesis C-methylase UbiE